MKSRGHDFGIAAEQNVGTAAGHVGRDRDRAFAARLRNDVGFTLVILGVQHFVPHAFFLSRAASRSDFSTEMVPTRTGWPRSWKFLDLLGGVAEFLVFGAVDDVLILDADHRPVGRDHGDFELVDLLELRGFRLRRTGHAGELLVHAEVILEGDGGERLVLALDLDAFLGFDGLVQTVAPAAAGHQAAGELVDDDDLAVLHHVILVLLEDDVGLEGLLDVVVPLDVLRLVHVADAEQPFALAARLLR